MDVNARPMFKPTQPKMISTRLNSGRAKTFRIERIDHPLAMSGPDQINLLAQQQTPQSAHFSHNDGGGDGHEWSGAESDDGSGLKRKRPMSVSCELCKQRKVKCEMLHESLTIATRRLIGAQVIVDSQHAGL